jgi:RNA polymerase sigma-70 factor (ECF subfamily)
VSDVSPRLVQLKARLTAASTTADREASFLAVYRQEGPGILRYLCTRARDLSEAEDLHAETFFRAWQAWARFQGEAAEVRAWLFRIARNLLIDRHRRQRLLWVMPLEEHHLPWVGDDVAAIAAGNALIRDIIGRMSAADGELLALRVAGLSHAEIGLIQGRSEQAVKIAWHRTLGRLRGHLRSDWMRPEPAV